MWADSSYDCGYWTSANEAWFQKRRAEILRGEAEVMSQQIWRKKLNSRRRFKIIHDAYAEAAANMLNTHVRL